MLDFYNRNINYLRISVTDRCNLRCIYCMPPDGVEQFSHNDILSFEEIRDFVKVAVIYGIDKVRITGGEPLVRKGVVGLLEMISKINGIKDLSMTTNGILLADYAIALKNAGLQRINVSLDTMSADKFRQITRGGVLDSVIAGILTAKKAGFSPIKINCVIEKSTDEFDAVQVKKFCVENDLEVRFIHRMDLEKGEFSVVEGGTGGNCRLCNRLRLTANGKLKPCLFSDIELDVRKMNYDDAIKTAVNMKPECGEINSINAFNNIGG